MTNKEIVDYVMKTPRNTNPSVLNSLLQQRSGGGSSVQPDWNQNDSTQADYIKNRPFYEEVGEIDIVPKQTREYVDNPSLYGGAVIPFNGSKDPCYDLDLVTDPGTTEIFLEINGEVYSGELNYYYAPQDVVFGDYTVSLNHSVIYPPSSTKIGDSFTFRIYAIGHTVKQIDSKYLSKAKYIAYDKYQNLAEEEQHRARTNLGIFGLGEYTIFLENSGDYSGTCDEDGAVSFTYNLEKPLEEYGFDYLEATINFSGNYSREACIIFPLPSSGENYLHAIVYYDGEQQVEVRIFNEKDINFIIRQINTNSHLHVALKDFRGLKTNFREKWV